MSAVPVFGEWQPIETAPRDGTIIRVRQGSWTPVHGYFAGGEWRFVEYAHPNPAHLTHWMPLPPAPLGREG